MSKQLININQFSFTAHNDTPNISVLTVTKNGIKYIIDGYCTHTTNDLGKIELINLFCDKNNIELITK